MKDLDQSAELRLRLRHTSHTDTALGCEIIILLLPGTTEASAAAAWLRQPNTLLDRGLDITGSVDDAIRFLERLGFGSGWTINREEPDDGVEAGASGLHYVGLVYRFFSCIGSGRTAATALVDVAMQAIASGADAYQEENLRPPTPGEGGAQTMNFAEPSEPEEVWSADLVERTRRVMCDLWPALDAMGRLYLKHYDRRFGEMDGYGLHRGILRVVDRNNGASTRFDTVENLLAAGWVVD